jgi:signal transduction histidine kinase
MALKLGEVDTLKQEFFSQMSHELRTPLTSIREATQLLLERVPGPLEPKQARLLEIVSASTERLLGMVNQILELSRLRAGLFPLERRPVDLDKLVARAVDELRPQAEDKGLRVVRAGAGADWIVLGDEDRLLRVVVNLLDNAVKYTPAGTVAVRLAARVDAVELSVEDEGIGIPSDALPQVFDPYQQARPGQPGSGLGLAIVKGLVEAHGGSVHVESEEGRGSRFTVLLPRVGEAG